MYNNPYLSSYSPQANIERINNQIAELEKMKSQMPTAPQQHQPTSINQNTFSETTYNTATIHVPATSFNTYFWKICQTWY